MRSVCLYKSVAQIIHTFHISSLSAKAIRPPNLANGTSYSTTSSLEVTASVDSWIRVSGYNSSLDNAHYFTKDNAAIAYVAEYNMAWFPLLAGEKVTLYGNASYSTRAYVFPMVDW